MYARVKSVVKTRSPRVRETASAQRGAQASANAGRLGLLGLHTDVELEVIDMAIEPPGRFLREPVSKRKEEGNERRTGISPTEHHSSKLSNFFRPKNWRNSLSVQTPHRRACSMPMTSMGLRTAGMPRGPEPHAGVRVASWRIFASSLDRNAPPGCLSSLSWRCPGG